MKKYHIYISDNENAECVKDFYVESEESMESVVKAVTCQVLYDTDLFEDNIESITPDALDGMYGVLIQCADHHVAIWCKTDSIVTMTVPDAYFDIASRLLRTAIDQNDPEMETLHDEIYKNA